MVSQMVGEQLNLSLLRIRVYSSSIVLWPHVYDLGRGIVTCATRHGFVALETQASTLALSCTPHDKVYHAYIYPTALRCLI